ncbi:hypothetical protein O181_013883 [Austropuccinia psidii MF-1]|uniref:Uncharacterized protein n=1 Tax=Austropuccinia psidii MF-1 TaxID=1389203 RepID=A0A9Q3BZJ9_9BASI|nr:hypothetical protein [Austropuccinia psidii MF-1]
MPCEQSLWQPAPGPSGTQWLEDLFCSKQPKIPFLISTFDSSELTLPPFAEPSQHYEPPIPGLSQPSEPHEDALTSRHATPASVIIIDNKPIGSPLPPIAPKLPSFPQ